MRMSVCEVVEMRNSADAVGYPCSRTASTQGSDCGSELCESHTETCAGCRSIFCRSCFYSIKRSTRSPNQRIVEKGESAEVRNASEWRKIAPCDPSRGKDRRTQTR